MGIGRKLVSNTVYIFLDWFSITLLGFFYWFFAAKNLAPSDYGIVSTSINFASVLTTILTFGTLTSLAKLIPEYLAKNKIKKISYLVKFSLKFNLATFTIALIFFIIFNNQISQLLKLPNNATILAYILIFIMIISGVSGMVIYGFQDMKKIFITDLVGNSIKVLSSSILIFLGFKYLGPLSGIIIGFLIISLWRLLLIKIDWKNGKINLKSFFKDYAFPSFIINIVSVLFLNGQYVLLTLLKSTEATGIFTIAMLISSVIATFPNIINTALFPITSQLSVIKKELARRNYFLNLSIRYSLFSSIPLIVFLILFSNQIILIFSSEKYLSASKLLPILSIASLFFAISSILGNQIFASGNTKISRNLTIFTTAVFFVFAVPLTGKFSSVGLSISFLITSILSFIVSLIFSKKILNFTFPLTDFIKCSVSSLIIFILAYPIIKILESLIIEILLLIVLSLIYLYILSLLKFYREEDFRILDILFSKLPKLNFFKRFLYKILQQSK